MDRVRLATKVPDHRRAARRSGMTVIELIVGLVLIAVAILGLNSLAVSAIRNNLSARMLDVASLLARQKLEDIRRAGFAATPPGTTVERDLDAAGRAGGAYRRTATVAAGPLPATRTVTVTVTYPDRGWRQVSFVTEIAG